MDLTAYALRSEYDGTVEVDGQQVPKFSGGVLHAGDGDFHVADSLALNDGVIVVQSNDHRLVELLNAYPALKHTSVPAKPKVISPYQRRTTDALHQDASLRDLTGHSTMSRPRLIAALAADDRAQARGVDATQVAEDAEPEVSDPAPTENAGSAPGTTTNQEG